MVSLTVGSFYLLTREAYVVGKIDRIEASKERCSRVGGFQPPSSDILDAAVFGRFRGCFLGVFPDRFGAVAGGQRTALLDQVGSFLGF